MAIGFSPGRTTNAVPAVIRLMKYLRDYKQTVSVKSVILTTLLGGAVTEARLWGDTSYCCDLPTARTVDGHHVAEAGGTMHRRSSRCAPSRERPLNNRRVSWRRTRRVSSAPAILRPFAGSAGTRCGISFEATTSSEQHDLIEKARYQGFFRSRPVSGRLSEEATPGNERAGILLNQALCAPRPRSVSTLCDARFSMS